jgi:hypothetical protein
MMYKEALRSVAGIGIFPVISLLLFVIVFTAAVVRACRMKHADTVRLAALPLDEGRAEPARESLT